MQGNEQKTPGVSVARMVTASTLILATGSRVYGLFFRLGMGALASGRTDAVTLSANILVGLVTLAAVWKAKKWGDLLAPLVLAFNGFGETYFVMQHGLIGSCLEQAWTVVRLLANGAGVVSGIIVLLERGRRRRAVQASPNR